MPKERRERSLSLDRSRLSPYPCSSSHPKQSLQTNPLEDDNNIKEWEDARCPVCMEHPHNAILLICSSHEKGCRPFMCDTSYRHSNCFDQFRKSSGDTSAGVLRREDVQRLTSPLLSAITVSETAVSDLEGGRSVEGSVVADLEVERSVEGSVVSDLEGERSVEGSVSILTEPSEKPVKPKLVCPLCRGQINGWTVVESARHFMNAKSRSCSCETCDFSGTYKDLRKHARSVHPLVRPTDTDPERQNNWRRLERQRDLGDLLSSLQSSFGEERTGESTLTIDEGGWLTVFFLVRFIGPGNASTRSGTSRARVAMRRSLRRLWGENYDGEAESRDEDDESSDGGQGARRRYVRRRLNNHNHEDQ